jgi:ATP-dependent DNA helicase RecG
VENYTVNYTVNRGEKYGENEKTSVKTSVKTEDKIVELLKGNKNITIPEIAEITGKSTRAIEMQISKLKEIKRIDRVGPLKGGYWKVID